MTSTAAPAREVGTLLSPTRGLSPGIVAAEGGGLFPTLGGGRADMVLEGTAR